MKAKYFCGRLKGGGGRKDRGCGKRLCRFGNSSWKETGF